MLQVGVQDGEIVSVKWETWADRGNYEAPWYGDEEGVNIVRAEQDLG
jgi:hypothetical protein